jgi:hypothetical protein
MCYWLGEGGQQNFSRHFFRAHFFTIRRTHFARFQADSKNSLLNNKANPYFEGVVLVSVCFESGTIQRAMVNSRHTTGHDVRGKVVRSTLNSTSLSLGAKFISRRVNDTEMMKPPASTEQPSLADNEDENSFLIIMVLFISIAFVLVLYARKIYSACTSASHVQKSVAPETARELEQERKSAYMSNVLTSAMGCIIVVAIIHQISTGLKSNTIVHQASKSCARMQETRLKAAVNVFTVFSSAIIPDAVEISIHDISHAQWLSIQTDITNVLVDTQPLPTSSSTNAGGVAMHVSNQTLKNNELSEIAEKVKSCSKNVHCIGPIGFVPAQLAPLLLKLETLRLPYSLQFSLSREALERERAIGILCAQAKSDRLAPSGFTVHTSTAQQYCILETITFDSNLLWANQISHAHTFTNNLDCKRPNMFDQISEMMDPCNGMKITIKTEFDSMYIPNSVQLV